MNCSELNGLLDQLMDGELADDQRRAMEAHARGCAECAAAIRATRQLKALMDQMEPEVDVPLEAQAGWRGAVREASKQRGRARVRRWIASAAAVAMVLVGVGLAFNLRGTPKQAVGAMPVYEAAESAVEAAAPEATMSPAEPAVMANGAAPRADSAGESARNVKAGGTDGAIVEADGAASEAMAVDYEEDMEAEEAVSAAGSRAPAWEISLQVEDIETACARIGDLVQEYEGSCEVQTLGGGGANIYVEIASDNAGDFLNAVMPMDTSGVKAEPPDLSGGGQVLVLLVLHS